MESGNWQKIKSFFSNINSVGTAVMVLGSIGAAVLAYLDRFPWSIIVLILLAVITMSALAINQFHLIQQRRERDFSRMSNKKIQVTLIGWLQKDGWTITLTPEDDCLFKFKAKDSFDRSVVVARPVEHENFITLGGFWNISGGMKEGIKHFTPEQLEEMLQDLRLAISKVGYDYEGLGSPFIYFKLQTRMACDESMTRALFFEKVSLMRNMQIIIQQLVKRAFARAGIEVPLSRL